jgi:hypothetical protein
MLTALFAANFAVPSKRDLEAGASLKNLQPGVTGACLKAANCCPIECRARQNDTMPSKAREYNMRRKSRQLKSSSERPTVNHDS